MSNDAFEPKFIIPEAAELFRASVFSDINGNSAGFQSNLEPNIRTQQELQVERDTLKTIAFSEGFAAGREDGIIAERKTIQPLLDRLAAIISDLSQTRNNLCRDIESQSVKLAFAIAEKIIQHEINFNPEIIIRAVSQSLEAVKEHKTINIRLHPEDAEYLREAGSEIKELIQQGKDITLIEDYAMQRGGCLVETNYGIVDASLESRLSVVKEALEGVQ